MRLHVMLALFAITLLAGCGDADVAEAGPGGVNAEDAKSLDAAAAKLDAEPAGETD